MNDKDRILYLLDENVKLDKENKTLQTRLNWAEREIADLTRKSTGEIINIKATNRKEGNENFAN